MEYRDALLIAAAFYAIVTAGATWLCVFIFDPLVPLRRDRKARRYVVIGFALLCFAVGYGIANAEVASGTLQVYYRPDICDPRGDLSRCTPDVYDAWMNEATPLRDVFWRWLLNPPIFRSSCYTISEVICTITNSRAYGNANVWFAVALGRGVVMSMTALIVGYLLTRPPKRKLTMEEEALLSLPRAKVINRDKGAYVKRDKFGWYS